MGIAVCGDQDRRGVEFLPNYLIDNDEFKLILLAFLPLRPGISTSVICLVAVAEYIGFPVSYCNLVKEVANVRQIMYRVFLSPDKHVYFG